MVNRLSVNVLLKSVIAIMGAAVMTALVLSAWDSWSRLQIANQIAVAADNTKYLFTAMHNLRTDRATTFGTVYSTLARLEAKGLVRSIIGEPTPERGGRGKKHFIISSPGRRALQESLGALRTMARGLDTRWEAP